MVGLELARQKGLGNGLRIKTQSEDLEVEPLPDGPFDLISCFNYRQRDLFPHIRERLKVGGYLLAAIYRPEPLGKACPPWTNTSTP